MGEEELLWNAVSEAIAPIAHLENQYETEKLEKKVRDYFKKGAKGLAFNGKAWNVLINEYTDAVFSSIFSGLGDREWLTEVDFLLCVDAGIKDFFPPSLFARVPQHVFEQAVLQAADRAFDEQRYWNGRWETLQRIITGKGTQKKVREAVDAGRAEAVASCPPTNQDFVGQWVRCAVKHLARVSQGDPRNCLGPALLVELFQALIHEGGLPLQLTASGEGLPPRNWPFVDSMVHQAYAEHGAGDGHDDDEPQKGWGKGMGKSKDFLGGSYCQPWQVPDGEFAEPGPKRMRGAW